MNSTANHCEQCLNIPKRKKRTVTVYQKRYMCGKKNKNNTIEYCNDCIKCSMRQSFEKSKKKSNNDCCFLTQQDLSTLAQILDEDIHIFDLKDLDIKEDQLTDLYVLKTEDYVPNEFKMPYTSTPKDLEGDLKYIDMREFESLIEASQLTDDKEIRNTLEKICF